MTDRLVATIEAYRNGSVEMRFRVYETSEKLPGQREIAIDPHGAVKDGFPIPAACVETAAVHFAVTSRAEVGRAPGGYELRRVEP